MGEENEEGFPQVEHPADALRSPILSGQLGYAEAADLLDEGRSSSLSDLEDGIDEIDVVSADSAPSRQIDADSEAETERLENSPNKNHDHRHIGTGAVPIMKSPGKGCQSVVPQVAEQQGFSDSVVSSPGPSDEDVESELPSGRSAASDGEHLSAQIRGSSARKRKHLEVEDGSGENAEAARRQRRRTQSAKIDAVEQLEPGLSREATTEPMANTPDDQDLLEGTSNILRDARSIAKSKGLKEAKGKHAKVRSQETLKNIVEEREDHDKLAGLGADEACFESDDEDAEAAAKDEEEYAKKMAAMDALAALEKHFAALRDRLYDERIVALNEEIAQLSAPKPSHPEFLRQLKCIVNYRDEKFETEQKLLVYKTKSLNTKSVAQRSQTHSAYFQTVRDVREKHLDRIGERLSRVRRDHVKTDEKIPSYSIPFPTRRSTQITQQSAYNKEVSLLSGIAKYVGFPAAPSVKSALPAEVNEDMEKMGISLNHNRTNIPTQPRMSRSAFSSAMSRPAAEEQFLEQNPWANPQHPVHLQQQTGRLSRQVSDQTQIADATTTPVTQPSLVDINGPADFASNIPEHLSVQASSALATPHSNDGYLYIKSSQSTAVASDQQLSAGVGKLQDLKERLLSLSPTETRKHSLLAYEAGLKKSNSIGGAATSQEEAASYPYKQPRIALFSTPGRPQSLPRNAPSNDQMGERHATSSPITLHQHAGENNLTSATGLSRIGAR